MERVEASLHGWPQAPYPRKVEVDANFKRMVEYGCRPEHARAVHLGVASHNLFDIAYGLRAARARAAWRRGRVRDARGHGQPPGARGAARGRAGCCSTRPWSAPRTSTARSPTSCAGSTRTPRRRTSCATLFGLDAGQRRRGGSERDRFLAAFAVRRRACPTAPPHPGPPRRASRCAVADAAAPFDNEPDTDWSLAREPRVDRRRSLAALARRMPRASRCPLQIGGRSCVDSRAGAGIDGRDPLATGAGRGLPPCARRSGPGGRGARRAPARRSRPGARGGRRSAARCSGPPPVCSAGAAAT